MAVTRKGTSHSCKHYVPFLSWLTAITTPRRCDYLLPVHVHPTGYDDELLQIQSQGGEWCFFEYMVLFLCLKSIFMLYIPRVSLGMRLPILLHLHAKRDN